MTLLLLANYSVTIAEDVTTGTELIRVVATDADSGERSAITFSLSGPKVNNTTSKRSIMSAMTVCMYMLLCRTTHLLWVPCLVR